MYHYQFVFSSTEVYKSKICATAGRGRVITIDDNVIDTCYTKSPEYLEILDNVYLIQFHVLSNKKKYLIVTSLLSGLLI